MKNTREGRDHHYLNIPLLGILQTLAVGRRRSTFRLVQCMAVQHHAGRIHGFTLGYKVVNQKAIYTFVAESFHIKSFVGEICVVEVAAI